MPFGELVHRAALARTSRTLSHMTPRRDTGGETERIKRIYERMAVGYDRQLDRVENLVFGDGRAWVCGQARGDVLEIAIGTGRNLAFCAADVRLTGIDVSPAMLERARRRAAALGRAVDLRLGDAKRSRSRTRRSTRS